MLAEICSTKYKKKSHKLFNCFTRIYAENWRKIIIVPFRWKPTIKSPEMFPERSQKYPFGVFQPNIDLFPGCYFSSGLSWKIIEIVETLFA